LAGSATTSRSPSSRLPSKRPIRVGRMSRQDGTLMSEIACSTISLSSWVVAPVGESSRGVDATPPPVGRGIGRSHRHHRLSAGAVPGLGCLVFRTKSATIFDSIPPQVPTEVRHQDGPLGAGRDIGCCGTKGRLQVNVRLIRGSGSSSAQLEDPDPTHSGCSGSRQRTAAVYRSGRSIRVEPASACPCAQPLKSRG